MSESKKDGLLRGWFAIGKKRMDRLAEWIMSRVSWSEKAEARGRKALDILEKKDQIRRVSKRHYAVKSQSDAYLDKGPLAKLPNCAIFPLFYDVEWDKKKKRWECSCPDHTHRRAQCKHILAVTAQETDRHACNVLGIPDENDAGRVQDSEPPQQKQTACNDQEDKKHTAEIFPVDEEHPEFCKHCKCTELIKYGSVSCENEKHQRWKCKNKKCGKVFVYRAGMERMRHTKENVCDAIDLFCKKVSYAGIADTLDRKGISIHPSSIYRWIKKFIRIISQFVSKLPINTGERSRVDELYIHIMGIMYYLFAMTDEKTRFMLAWRLGEQKDGFNATELFEAAEKRAGKKPSELVSDELGSYKEAFREVYRQKNPLDKPCVHIDDAGLAKKHNNNAQESFNSNARPMMDSRRGIKSMDSRVFDAWEVYYNFIRTHSSIKCTPAEAAGVKIHGNDKWWTLIGNACVAAWGK